MQLENKVALVTGGAVRVGRAISLALAGARARLVLHYHSSAKEAEATAREIEAAGGQVNLIQADLGSMAEVRRLADEAARPFGPVDVLVNSASVFPAKPFGEVDEGLWEATMAVNLRAPFFLSQLLGAKMKARGAGVIVNLVDLAGMQAWSGYAAHAISKAGLLHLTHVAARALAPEVRVNGIAPGTVLPPEDLPEEEVRKLAERTPLRRNGSPEDVVKALLYLIDADFVTGEVLVVDGGRIIATR